jgi:hypothetical protein
VPGSSTKVAIYDERLKSLLSYDFETKEYGYIMKKVEFKIDSYNFLNNS